MQHLTCHLLLPQLNPLTASGGTRAPIAGGCFTPLGCHLTTSYCVLRPALGSHARGRGSPSPAPAGRVWGGPPSRRGGGGAMAVTEKPHVLSSPLPVPQRWGYAASPSRLRLGPLLLSDMASPGRSMTLGAGRGGGARGGESVAVAMGDGGKPEAGGAARRGEALCCAVLARVLPSLSPRVGWAAAALWAASSPAAGSSSSGRRREPTKTRRPARRRRRSTAGTSEPRYRRPAACRGWAGVSAALVGSVLPWSAVQGVRRCGRGRASAPGDGRSPRGRGDGARPSRELIAPGTAVAARSAQLSAFILKVM